MRHSDERPQTDSSPAQPPPLAPGAILRTGNGIPDQAAPAQTVAPQLDPGTPSLPTLAAQGDMDHATAQEGQPATDRADHAADREQTKEASESLPAPPADPVATSGGQVGGVRVKPTKRDGGPDNLTRSELRVLREAVKTGRAIITDEERRLIPETVANLVVSARTQKLQLAACKTWVQLDSLNLRAEIAASEAERAKATGGNPSVTVNVNVDATSGPLARIKRLQGESEGETATGGASPGG